MTIQRILYALLLALFITAPVLAQQGPADRIDRRLAVLDEKLELTDEQEAQIKQIWSGHRDALKAWSSQNADASRDERREYFRGRSAEVHAAVQAILTPDQAEKLTALRAERGDRLGSDRRPGARMGGKEDGRRSGRGVRDEGRGMRGDGRGMRDDGRGMRGDAGMFMNRIADQLELTDAQRTDVQNILESHHAEGSAWRDAHPDATREQMMAYHEGHFAQLKTELGQILTPEQIEQFEKLHEQRRDRMSHRKHRN